MHPAAYWTQNKENIQCALCPHTCIIAPSKTGLCQVRRSLQGKLAAEAYGAVSSLALDPIEKKPLYHVKPGTNILSLGSYGCNFRCSFCQNWNISQKKPKLFSLTPEEVAGRAREMDVCGVAYTYNEPLVNFEYVLDCACLVKKQGLLNVVVTNGYIQPEPLQALLPWIDAWNIDLKSIRPEFYQRFCGGTLEPVLQSIQLAAASSHVELAHLVVTNGNDDLEQIQDLVAWMAKVSPEIPLHITRYYPQYQWEAEPTDPDFMLQAYRIAKKQLSWVYLGNIGLGEDSLKCPDCGAVLVERKGYHTKSINILKGHCPSCQRKIPGLF